MLHARRFQLRPFAPADIAALAALAGQRRVADAAIGVPSPFTRAYARAWIASHAAAWALRQSLHWAIVDVRSVELVGYAGLAGIDSDTRQAELRFWVARGVERNSVAIECTRRVLEFAWGALRMARAHALQRLHNPAAGHVLEALRMKREGIVRTRLPESDQLEDVALWAITDLEYRGAPATAVESTDVRVLHAGTDRLAGDAG